MPIKLTFIENIAIFFFAHQDDEFGIFKKIIDEHQNGRRVICVYFTNGDSDSCQIKILKRNKESINILINLGVFFEDIYFIGNKLSIPDAQLPYFLEVASNWVEDFFDKCSNIEAIYVPAWEGGHHDHDALHALIVNIADQRNILSYVKQFALYNSYQLNGPFFRVLSPLAINGRIEKTKISLKNRIYFSYCCLGYPSQIKTWVGLFPFVFFHYIFWGEQTLQQVSIKRTFQKPHDGNLYYEKRKFFTWEKMEHCLHEWRHKKLT
jgi:hypothetical protein